jgi:uncharacterized protein YndB with AHSA1/START domain
MKWVTIVVGVLVALVLLVVLIGWALPVKHHVTREATYAASPAELFALITDVDAFPSWRSKMLSVERDTNAMGRTRFRETTSDGNILYEIDRAVPDQQLITRIADPDLPFGGTWTFELYPIDTRRTTLRITEDGEIYNPIFRFVSQFVLGYYGSLDTYLQDVGKKFKSSGPPS